MWKYLEVRDKFWHARTTNNIQTDVTKDIEIKTTNLTTEAVGVIYLYKD